MRTIDCPWLPQGCLQWQEVRSESWEEITWNKINLGIYLLGWTADQFCWDSFQLMCSHVWWDVCQSYMNVWERKGKNELRLICIAWYDVMWENRRKPSMEPCGTPVESLHGADFLPCHLIQLPLYVGSKPFLYCAMISKTHEDGQENFVVKADEYWRWSSMEFLSEGHKCRFCGMCCFKARLVSILEIVLGEIKRQNIIVCEFEGFIKWYPLVVADVLGIQSRFFLKTGITLAVINAVVTLPDVMESLMITDR